MYLSLYMHENICVCSRPWKIVCVHTCECVYIYAPNISVCMCDMCDCIQTHSCILLCKYRLAHVCRYRYACVQKYGVCVYVLVFICTNDVVCEHVGVHLGACVYMCMCVYYHTYTYLKR